LANPGVKPVQTIFIFLLEIAMSAQPNNQPNNQHQILTHAKKALDKDFDP
jgi:hypothetical protein